MTTWLRCTACDGRISYDVPRFVVSMEVRHETKERTTLCRKCWLILIGGSECKTNTQPSAK